MARGGSGRIVIEVDPGMKRRLYSSLALTGSTLKDWFIKTASDYIGDREEYQRHGVSYARSGQEAPLIAEQSRKYKTKKPPKA